jgi:beta-galactosidase
MPANKLLKISRRGVLQLGSGATVAPLVSLPEFAAAQERLLPSARGQSFNAGWRFHRGEKAGAAEPGFDDRAWRALDLPHDWSIEDIEPQGPAANAPIREVDTAPIWAPVKGTPSMIGPFEGAPPPLLLAASRSSGGRHTGHTLGGIGWYRKRFRLPPLPADARVEVVFDGVYANSELWLNGRRLGSNDYGYTPFGFDLTPHLDPRGENVLAVRVENLGVNSRWYSGSGIYRAVELNITRGLRFGRWGVRLTTREASLQEATVALRARIEGLAPGAILQVQLRDAAGRIAARTEVAAEADNLLSLVIANPALWSPENPALYEAECTLAVGGEVHDRMSTAFGIRTLEVTPEAGLRINGKATKLRGGCVHHDNGLLGAAALDRAEARKVELLKARGFNAVRTSHNRPSTTFLDACDRLGMLVIEEAFDVWNVPKLPEDYHLYFQARWREDLAAMVERDANHPSVIMWSIGNEIPEKTKPLGVETARALVEEVRRLDPTRPITAGLNEWNGPDVVRADGASDQAAPQFLDVAGYNYKFAAYEKEHPRFPKRVFVGTESFPSEVDAIWRVVERNPYVLGDFVWTAMDYIGEAGIGMSALEKFDPFKSAYPWFNAFCGDLDLIGEQKPQSLLRDVVWGLSPVEMSVERPLPAGKQEIDSKWGWGDELQSWTWPGAEGKPLTVSVFTRGDRVELTLDGRRVGEKSLVEADGSRARFAVDYAPGKLVASAYRAGKLIGRRTLETVGPPAGLRLRADRPRITTARGDLAFVTIEVVDAKGRHVPDAVAVLEAALSGPVELAAFGNANPRGVASFQQPVAKTWHGRALAVVRPLGLAGDATIEVRSSGLRPAQQRLQLRRSPG